MKSELRNRLKRIFDCCKGVDKIIISNTIREDPNFIYLTQFKGESFENNLLIADTSGLRLYTSELDFNMAMAQRFEGLKIIKAGQGNFHKLLHKELKGRSIGVNGSFIPYGICNAIKLKYKPKKIIDVSKCLMRARLVKSKGEIELIGKAAKITRKAMETIKGYCKEGITERELARKFDDISTSLGSEETAFPTIVCFGRNAAQPHHFPDSTKLKVGDFVLIDAGAKISNYRSDITRTFIFGDKSRIKHYGKLAEVYNTVRDAQQIAINAIKAGVKGKYVDGLARDLINTAFGGRYKNTFIHTLGHSLGLEEHDGEVMSQGSDVILEEGMVFTVEPGIYVTGFGGVRIEDDIVVTKKGCRVL